MPSIDNPFVSCPSTVLIHGDPVDINPDFRIFVSLDISAAKGSSEEASNLFASFYRGKIPSDIPGAINAMFEFYAGARSQSQGAEEAKHKARVYDFTQDGDALLSSFLSAYGIDLSTVNLHWWTFIRLMTNLPPGSPFMQRIHYRTADTSKMSKNDRARYAKMRRIYAIKDVTNQKKKSMTVEEREQEMRDYVKKRFEAANAAQQKKSGD